MSMGDPLVHVVAQLNELKAEADELRAVIVKMYLYLCSPNDSSDGELDELIAAVDGIVPDGCWGLA